FTRQISPDELGGRSSELPFHFAWYRRRFTLKSAADASSRGAAGASRKGAGASWPAGIDPARQRLRPVVGAGDYRADVWLDGAKLNLAGPHVGTFNSFAFDLPVLAAQTHTVVVRVQKPLDPGILSCGAGLGTITDLKINIDGTKGYHDSRPGGNDDNF